MAQSDYDPVRPDFRYFVEGQLTVLAEHPPGIDPERLAVLVKQELISRDDRLANIQIDPGRVQVFQSNYDTAQRAEHPNDFSLAFADILVDDETLLDVIDQVDKRIAGQDTAHASDSSVILQAVSPNWLASPAYPRHIGTGGPGAKPVPYKPANGTSRAVESTLPYDFTIPMLANTKQRVASEAVEVAILDTAPSPCALEKAYQYWAAEHSLLRELLGPQGVFALPNDQFSITYADPAQMNPLNHPASYYGIAGHDYPMSDHGLFVAGIIHTIAPSAHLHLIQVLNDYGIGTLETISAGLNRLATRVSSLPLLVNLSLTLSLPLDPKHEHPKYKLNWQHLKQDKLFASRLTSMLEWICSHLHRRNAILVAAAGNDWHRRGPRPKARIPAGFDCVVGVGALNKLEPGQDPQVAAYSNLSDAPKRAGIITFGGNTSLQNTADQEKGILGIYIGQFPNGQLSTNGWARWAGTSFSTPVVSGVLARLCAARIPPADAVQAIYDAEPEPTKTSEQLLRVSQGA
ncbi:MAG TPA: S8/S53 family peptidase [Anaerolineaceae bacterium]|nr:S8/S53 family peptidase [Anaerolineaceae bacterium]